MALSYRENGGGIMVTREDVLSAFQFRHATKKFDETKKISDQDFNVILEAGRLSPSSFGFEPWRFVVIQNTQLRNELRTVTWGAQGQLPTASHYVAILCLKDGMRYDSSHVTHMMRDIQHLSPEMMEKKRERFREFQRENGILETPKALFDWAVKQSYIALGNMHCWVSIHVPSREEICRLLKKYWQNIGCWIMAGMVWPLWLPSVTA